MEFVQRRFAPDKLARYGQLNSRDIAKLCALAAMFVDHIGKFLAEDDPMLRTIGRLAPPIFFFLVGFAPSYRWSHQLLVGLCILVACDAAIGHEHVIPINVLGSIIIVRMMLRLIEFGRLKLRRPFEWIVALVALFPLDYFCAYMPQGALFGLAGYMQFHSQRYSARLRCAFLIVVTCLYAGWEKLVMANLVKGYVVLLLGALIYPLVTLRLRSVRLLSAYGRLAWLLSFTSRYSLWIYVCHLAALQLLRGGL